MTTLTPSGSPYFRIDPQHRLVEMMEKAVSRLHSSNIQIRLQDDSVLLTGTVDYWHEKQHAQESVRELSGSRTIRNSLQVVGR